MKKNSKLFFIQLKCFGHASVSDADSRIIERQIRRSELMQEKTCALRKRLKSNSKDSVKS